MSDLASQYKVENYRKFFFYCGFQLVPTEKRAVRRVNETTLKLNLPDLRATML